MTDTLRSSKFPEREKEILGRTPMKRWGEPEDIAGPIYFLSSEELAGFVTGVILPIDGGYLAYP
jgi:NAD(P)-dependent dehydrogenase (short-subunit alcohol dehydrogenase family)